VRPNAAVNESVLDETLRREIAASPGRTLGRGYQASVHLYSAAGRDVVVKKPHRSAALGWLWRHLVQREQRVYERLDGIAGIPRSYGLVGGESLALEYFSGPSLRAHEDALTDREAFFARLLATLKAMHAAGVAHGDLKRKDNVIVTADETPYVVDFGIAALRAPSGWFNRLVFDTVRQMDYNAWVKLKYRGRGNDLSAADAPLYRPLLIERVARAWRVAWQKATLRRPRQRWRKRRRR
jgi:predicted Ser/Thr protein kinase